MIEVWAGTPREMAKMASKPTQAAAVKWADSYLQGMEKQAEKFDRQALDALRSTREQMRQARPVTSDSPAFWQFDYISITFRIELRSTP